jgi:uncharacterized protein (TIGR04222 family)
LLDYSETLAQEDLLMTSIFSGIDGPDFLFFYSYFAAMTLVMCGWYVYRKDGTRSMDSLAPPAQVDPFEAAYLAGGQDRLAMAATVGLLECGHIKINDRPYDQRTGLTDRKSKKIEQTGKQIHTTILTAVEQAVYDWFVTPRTEDEMRTGLTSQVGSSALHYEEKLQQQRLLSDESHQQAGQEALVLGGAFLAILGGLRLFFGLAQDKPVGFLVCLMLGSLYLLYRICRVNRLSHRGKVYQRWLKLKVNEIDDSQGTDRRRSTLRYDWSRRYALMAAMFGATGLLCTPFSGLQEFFVVSKAGGWAGGGDGGGGGGDGGGGGCGGCGGCG